MNSNQTSSQQPTDLEHWSDQQLRMIMANSNVSASGRKAAQRTLTNRNR